MRYETSVAAVVLLSPITVEIIWQGFPLARAIDQVRGLAKKHYRGALQLEVRLRYQELRER